MNSADVSRPAAPCVLALGVSGERCSVALRRQGATTLVVGEPRPGRSGQIVGMVRALCGQQRLSLSQIDVIGFDAGPGGFTALRVACGVAQGLAFALDRPVVAVGALAALAWQAPAGRRAFVAIDARMGELYFAVYDRPDGTEPRAAVLPAVASPENVVQLFERLRGDGEPPSAIGDGFARHPALAEWATLRAASCAADARPHAGAVAELAELGWRDGRAQPAADVAPAYVRDKVALDVDEQARARAVRRP